MSYDLAPWQRRLVEALSRLHKVVEEGPKLWENLPSSEWWWVWERIIELQKVSTELYKKGAEETRMRIKGGKEVISPADW